MVDSSRLTFQASGSLWRDALVIQDLETKSLWSQVSGECIDGEMEGTKLTLFNSFHMTFKEFKEQYPEGLLLSKPEKGKEGSPYDSYFADNSKLGIFGRVDNFQRLSGKEKVFGLRLPCKNIAVSKKYLSVNSYAWIDCSESTVLITYNKDDNSVAAFLLDGKRQSNLDNYNINNDTIIFQNNEIVWNARTGRVIKGKGTNLKTVPVITAYWFAWASFFADTELIN